MNEIVINHLGIAVGANDQHAEWITKEGRLDHDWFTLDILRPFIWPGNIIDIGANIGTHTIFYERIANTSASTVFAFEANPISFKCLTHNCKKAIRYPVALGDSVSLLTMHSSVNLGSAYVSNELHHAGGISERHRDPNQLTVPCATLDSFLLDNIAFIKIDVEGYEEFVLKGSHNTIMKSRPLIWVELAPGHLRRANSSIAAVLEWFAHMKYLPAFYKGIPQQCDVMMTPLEMSEACLKIASKTPHIQISADYNNIDAPRAFEALNSFLVPK